MQRAVRSRGGFNGRFHVRPGGLGHRYGIDQHSRSSWARMNQEKPQKKTEKKVDTEEEAEQTAAPTTTTT